MPEEKILIVEDESIIALDIARSLKSLGYAISAIAATGHEALDSLLVEKPDLALLDIALDGGMDGIEVAASIRKNYDIPVVFLTSHSDRHTLARALETTPSAYLLKPFNERELQTTIATTLSKHRVEQKLREREHWLATVLNSIGDALLIFDRNLKLTYLSPMGERLIGCGVSECLGKRQDELFTLYNETSKDNMSLFQKKSIVSDSDSIFNLQQAQLKTTGGDSKYVEYGLSWYTNCHDEVEGIIMVIRNIDALRQAEIALDNAEQEKKQIEKRVNNIIANLPVGTIMLDRYNEEILFINSRGSEYLSMMNIDESFHEIFSTFVKPNWKEINIEKRYQIRIGSLIFGYSIYLIEQNMICIYLRDITEEERMKVIAESINVMDNLDIIFSSIRHEIGNPLSVLMTTVSVLEERLQSFDEKKRTLYFRRIFSAIHAIRDLLGQLRTFNVNDDVTLERMDLLAAVRLVVDQFTDQADLKGITMSVVSDLNECSIAGNKTAVGQVLMNIVKNAVDAVSGRHRPTIQLTISRDKKRVYLNVADNGCGIEAANLRKVFTPFYSKKQAGIGLGLTIVQKLMTEMNGMITIESEAEKGTVLSLVFDRWLEAGSPMGPSERDE